MSNFLAVATVTTVLGQLLQGAARRAVPGAAVTTGRPETGGDVARGAGINLYLYQVSPNGALRNNRMPARAGDGTLLQRPQVALDLYYLLTFYGDDLRLEPQRLLGSAVSALESQPVLTRERIQGALSAAVSADPQHYLAGSDLAEQVETVKLTPLSLNLEELSKLWSVFIQTPYALSCTHQASVVLIDGDGSPRAALPVRSPRFSQILARQPTILRVSDEDARRPLTWGRTLRLEGTGLAGPGVRVRVQGAEVTPKPSDLEPGKIRVPLATPPFRENALEAGVGAVQVVFSTGEEEGGRGSLVESNVAAFVLRPTISNVTVGGVSGEGEELRAADVVVGVEPAVGPGQRALLFLNEKSAVAPGRFSFETPPRDEKANALTFRVRGVKPGEYLVRVQVDGAESLLDIDENEESSTFGEYVGPAAVIP